MNRECMICLEETPNFVKFPCGHEVCVHCYPKVMTANPECPLCRRQLLPPEQESPEQEYSCFCVSMVFATLFFIGYVLYGLSFFSKRRS